MRSSQVVKNARLMTGAFGKDCYRFLVPDAESTSPHGSRFRTF